jgi:Ion channel
MYTSRTPGVTRHDVGDFLVFCIGIYACFLMLHEALLTVACCWIGGVQKERERGMISLVPLFLSLLLICTDERWTRGAGFVKAFSSSNNPVGVAQRSSSHRLRNDVPSRLVVAPKSSARRLPTQLLQVPLSNGASDLPNPNSFVAKPLARRRNRRNANASNTATTTRLSLQLPKAADNVKDTVYKSFNFVGHVDRFLGSLLFQKDTLSECVVQALQSLMLFLFRGSLVPFPSLRNLVFDKANRKKLTLGISPRTALAFVAAYMLTGVVAYSFVVEKWSLVDALYFSTVCFTTVGYGDLSPTNRLSQLFTGLFGVSGVVLLGSAVATLGSNLVQTQVEAVATAAAESKKRLMGLFEGMPGALTKYRTRPRGPVTNSYLESLASSSDSLLRRPDDYPQEIRTVKVGDQLRRILPALATVFVGGFITNVLNGGSWTSLDSVYYSLVTGT